MSEKVYKRIVDLLSEKGVDFEIIEHEPVYTSRQAAEVRGTRQGEGAKALVFKADGMPVMLVLPGDRRVDVKRFKSAYKFSDLNMVKPEEVEDLMEGVKVGAVHPLGNLHNIKVYVDKSLGRSEKIVFNAGLHDKSIKMYYKDYYGLVKPKIGNFTS